MNTLKRYVLPFAWLVAVVATLGSLYFSEVMKLPPCVLCWYQRIAMYPLTIMLFIGLLRKDRNVAVYTLPLAIIGAVIAIYHNLLYYQILPESAAPCSLGVSCTIRLIEWLGFITIPLLSLVAFLLIIGSLIIFMRKGKHE